MLSISGRIKKSTKQGLPVEARGMTPKGSSRGSVSCRVTRKDDIDRDIMELNSKRSVAKMCAMVPLMYPSSSQDKYTYGSVTPSIYSDFMTQTVCESVMDVEQSGYNYRPANPDRSDRKSSQDLEKSSATPKAVKKSSLAMPAEYKPDRPQSNNLLKRKESGKVEVSGIDSTKRDLANKAQPVIKSETSKKRNSERVEQSFPGQFYADDLLKLLRDKFIKKEFLPDIDDKEFLRKEQLNGEIVLEQNIEELLKQHDQDRGGGDHGPCYFPGQLMQKLPFPKEGTLKKDFKPINFNDAKPIFGDANMPKAAFKPKLPGEKDTTYRVI
jgi:hypothetical protein